MAGCSALVSIIAAFRHGCTIRRAVPKAQVVDDHEGLCAVMAAMLTGGTAAAA